MSKTTILPTAWLVVPDDQRAGFSQMEKSIRQSLGKVFSLQREQSARLQVQVVNVDISAAQAKESLVIYLLPHSTIKPPGRHVQSGGIPIGLHLDPKGTRRRELRFYGPDGQIVRYEEYLYAEEWVGIVSARERGDMPYLDILRQPQSKAA